MNEKKILLIGGAGFIGYHLAKKLSEKYSVEIFDNFSRGTNDNSIKKLRNIEIKKLDLNKIKKFKLKIYSHIFYLAAIVGVKNVIKDPFYTFQNNIMPFLNVVNSIRKYKKTKLIFFSTSEVYSPSIFSRKIKFPLKENNPIILKENLDARDSYYVSKIFGEKICQLNDINYICLRPHNVYGPRMGYSHVIPEIIRKFQKKKSVGVYSPNHMRAFCFIDDAVNQIIKLSLKNKNQYSIYNIGNMSQEIKMIDLAKTVKKILKSKKSIKKEKNTEGSPYRRVPDMKRTLKEIKYKNSYNLENGIKKTIEWYLKHESFD
ncbi:MAG: NAD(P)-dependent oxidoreductase [Pelagibacterales bacterium]|nr:NAD(P)-dependent oxidoreductase [Pelagibacterales bacterium]